METPADAQPPADAGAAPAAPLPLRDVLKGAQARSDRFVARVKTRFLDDPRWFVPGPHPRRFILTLERGLLLFAIALFATGLAAALAATVGLFRVLAPIVIVLWSAAIAGSVLAAARGRIEWRGTRLDLVALALATLLAISAGPLHHHIYSAQTDIGFYVTDASVISRTGGRVLDGPYDNLLPGFSRGGDGYRIAAMFGYSSLAAVFAYMFGLLSIPWVNAPLAFITVLSLYQIGRYLNARLGAIFGLVFYMTSLVTLWLSRWVMTENAATATFWVGALLMIRLSRGWDWPAASALLITLFYGGLVRMEGIVVAVWFLFILILRFDRPLVAWIKRFWSDPTLRARRNRTLVGAAVVLAVAIPLGAALWRALPQQYITTGFKVAQQFLRGRPAADALDVPTTGVGPNWGDYALRFEWDSAVAYFLPWFLLVAVLGILLRIVPWKRALFLAALCIPYVVFIMIPPVTTAHPWFMRRLWVAIIPLVYMLAGASLDFRLLAWRWPLRTPERTEGRVRNVLLGVVILLLLVGENAQIASPLALKREQDGVSTLVPRIDALVPEDMNIIVDQDAVELASLLRMEHDGPVISWFNNREQSFFASIWAAETSNNTAILRVPIASRHPLAPDIRGFDRFESVNASGGAAPRTDFRGYINAPPLRQGYAPLESYLEKDVPPARWLSSNVTYQLVYLKDPIFISKHVTLDPQDWLRTPIGLVAIHSPSNVTINTDRFSQFTIQQRQLGLHLVEFMAAEQTLPITSPDHPGTLATLHDDGSRTLQNVSIKLPRPLDVQTLEFSRGTVLRGILVDLYR